MDLNWQSHPFRKRGTYGDRLPALRQLLDEFEGCVWWGGDWQSPIDEMHFQLNYPEGDSRLEVMATKLRGGFIPKDEPAEIIVREGQARGYTRGEIIAILSTGLQESNLNQNATDSTGHRGIFQQDGGYPDRETAEGNIRGFFDRLDAKRRNKGGVSPDIWKNIFWLQQRPSEATSWRMTVIAGSSRSAAGKSSKPAIAIWSLSPRSLSARAVPRLITLRAVKIAVGGSARARRWPTWSIASASVRTSRCSYSGRCGMPAAAKARR